MKLTPQRIGDAFGRAGLLVMFAVAVVVVTVLHFAGLLILGALVWLVSMRAELDEARPGATAPEGAERRRLNGFIRFYRSCAMVLALLGVAGLLAQWQGWLPW